MTENAQVVNFNALCRSETPKQVVSRFRKHLHDLVFRGPLISMSGSHPNKDTLRGLQFTFSQSELEDALRRSDGSVVIHHGTAVAIANGEIFDLFEEHLMPLAPVYRGPLRLNPGDVADLLTGRVRSWEAFSRGQGAIRLLCHGDPVHHQTLLACLKRTFGIAHLSADVELLPSYAALASAARNCTDCIVFGLRPSQRIEHHLVPVTLAGVDPSMPGDAQRVPSLPIQIAWRGDSDGLQLARRVGEILGVIAKRVEADTLVLRQLVRRDAA